MKAIDFPACCTASIMKDFGESQFAEDGDDLYPEAKIEKFIKDTIAVKRAYGDAMITVITNSEQKRANSVLRKLGFNHSKWAAKSTHPETKIRLWYLVLN